MRRTHKSNGQKKERERAILPFPFLSQECSTDGRLVQKSLINLIVVSPPPSALSASIFPASIFLTPILPTSIFPLPVLLFSPVLMLLNLGPLMIFLFSSMS